jgi:uncharacterized protein YlxP (DUF503 family)
MVHKLWVSVALFHSVINKYLVNISEIDGEYYYDRILLFGIHMISIDSSVDIQGMCFLAEYSVLNPTLDAVSLLYF